MLFLIFASTIIGCISISALSSLIVILIGITSCIKNLCKSVILKYPNFLKNRKLKLKDYFFNLGLKTPLSQIPLLVPVSFFKYEINEIVNNFSLAGDKFMPDMHLRQAPFTYSACRPFTKNKEKIQKFEETGNLHYIYQNELGMAWFEHIS